MNKIKSSVLATNWQYLALALVLLSMLAGFFLRSVEFHDEVINLGKAQEGKIFDYALRPVFYGINFLAVRMFGSAVSSLSLAAYLAFVGTAILSFEYVRRDLGATAALATVAAIAWSGLVYFIGLRGMPHLYPAFFVMAAILLMREAARLGWGRRLAITALLWMGLLSHPTGVALLTGFFFMFLAQYVHSSAPFQLKGVLAEVARWAAILLASWLMVELLFYWRTDPHRFYASFFLDGLHNTSSIKSVRYHEPFLFYFRRVAVIGLPLICILAAIGLMRLFAYFAGRNIGGVLQRPLLVKAASLSLAALVSLLVVSLEQWKFDRVLVTFLPLTLLALCYSIFALAGTGRTGRVLTGVCALLITCFCLHSFIGQVSAAEKRSEKRFAVYSASLDVIHRMDTDVIGYLGLSSHFRIASVPVVAAGKELVAIRVPAEAADNPAALANQLVQNEHRFIILDLAGHKSVVATFHKLAYSRGFRRLAVISSGKGYEVWDIAPASLGVDVEHSLGQLTGRQKVGVLLAQSDQWAIWSLEGQLFGTKVLGKSAVASGKKLRDLPVLFVSKDSNSKKVSERLRALQYQMVGELGYVEGHAATIDVWARQGAAQ